MLPAAYRPLLGRTRELAFLLDRLREAATGSAACVILIGEPGIGKTRLSQAFSETAAREGATVMRGAAFVAEGMPPYLPFLEALGRYIQEADVETLRHQVGGKGPALASIFPELMERLRPLEAGYPLPPDQARLRLFEAVADLLAEIADPRPLVLMLDDLHWADSASLDMLCHILRYQPAGRLLIVGTLRQGEANESTALEHALTELTRLRRLFRLQLEPLGPTDLGALCEEHLGGKVEARTISIVHGQSEGNPFFAEELLRGWEEAGLLTRTSSTAAWALTEDRPATLPASIAGAVRLRLARLPAELIDPLRVAAIVGRSFTARLLSGLLSQSEEPVEELLQPGLQAGLLRTQGPGEFTFSHEKIREVLYSEVSSARRARLHEQIGLALEAMPTPAGSHRLSDLAFHFARSSDRERGARYSQQAALAAMQSYAAEEARLHFRAALSQLDSRDPRRGAVLLGLGEASLLASDEEDGARWFRQALAYLEPDDFPARARAAHGLGRALWRQDLLEPARQALEEGLRILGEATSTSEAVLLRVELATLVGVVLGRMDDSLAHAEKALLRARSLRDARWEAPATRTLGFLQVLDNRLPEGLALLEESLRLAEAADDPAEAAEACSALAQAYAWQARFDQSRAISLRREAFAFRCQQPYQLRYVYSWLAYLDAVQGSWRAAELQLGQAQFAVERMASHRPAAFLNQVQGFLAYQRGDFLAAAVSIERALGIFRSSDPQELLLCLGTLALSLQAAGEDSRARICQEELMGLLAQASSGRLAIGSAHSCLALLAICERDRAKADDYYSLLLPFRGQHHWFLVDRILGELAFDAGDLNAAGVHLSEAEAIATREQLRPELGRILLDQAELARVDGRPEAIDRAREILGRARTTFQDLEMAPGVLQAERRLAELGRDGPRPPRRTYVAGLSEREVVVLRLVASGMSNREIASELALSENTVAKHLTSIFNKTGLDNRAAATAFAIRSGLA